MRLTEAGDEQEDAMRRDATINALFYNLHTEEVEDFTGGLKDLASKTIRTPMNPETTFIDDPLRILRLIRFARYVVSSNFLIFEVFEVFKYTANA